MPSVSELMSQNISNTITNYKTWGGILYNVKEFGAVGDGIHDDTSSIQKAANAATDGGVLYFPIGTYLISDTIQLPSNINVSGSGISTVVRLGNGDMTGFLVLDGSGVYFRDMKIYAEATGTTPYVGGIRILNSANCTVENVLFDGLSWSGVFIDYSSNNIVKNCRFANWKAGPLQDSADVTIYHDSNYNVVDGCYLYGGGDHGVIIQDPYAGSKLVGNKVVNCQVGEHKAYGIVAYMTTHYRTDTIIANNTVQDILGTQLSGASGAGIYIQSAGAAIVKNNTVTNCCRETTNWDTLGMAQISVTNILTGSPPVIVEGNAVYANHGPCIYVSTSDISTIISGNSLTADSDASLRGQAIYTVNAKGLIVVNNTIEQKSPTHNAISIGANASIIDHIQLQSNTIKTVKYGVAFNITSTGEFVDVLISGLIVYGGDNLALLLQKITSCKMTNCDFSSTGVLAQISNCPKFRCSATRFYSGFGSYSLVFSGTNTGSIVDESNEIAGSIIVENDPGSGVIISQYGNSAPAGSGIWEVGDRVIQSAPVVGQPKGWRCTVAGSPGTWVSEGNL